MSYVPTPASNGCREDSRRSSSGRRPCATSARRWPRGLSRSTLVCHVPWSARALRFFCLSNSPDHFFAQDARASGATFTVPVRNRFHCHDPLPARPCVRVPHAPLFHTLSMPARAQVVEPAGQLLDEAVGQLQAGWRRCAHAKPRVARALGRVNGMCGLSHARAGWRTARLPALARHRPPARAALCAHA